MIWLEGICFVFFIVTVLEQQPSVNRQSLNNVDCGEQQTSFKQQDIKILLTLLDKFISCHIILILMYFNVGLHLISLHGRQAGDRQKLQNLRADVVAFQVIGTSKRCREWQ